MSALNFSCLNSDPVYVMMKKPHIIRPLSHQRLPYAGFLIIIGEIPEPDSPCVPESNSIESTALFEFATLQPRLPAIEAWRFRERSMRDPSA